MAEKLAEDEFYRQIEGRFYRRGGSVDELKPSSIYSNLYMRGKGGLHRPGKIGFDRQALESSKIAEGDFYRRDEVVSKNNLRVASTDELEVIAKTPSQGSLRRHRWKYLENIPEI